MENLFETGDLIQVIHEHQVIHEQSSRFKVKSRGVFQGIEYYNNHLCLRIYEPYDNPIRINVKAIKSFCSLVFLPDV